MPDEDKNFGGSLVLDFGQWWRHVKTIYKPHSTRSGGGVALYIRENLSYTNRIDLVPDALEMIMCRDKSSSQQVISSQHLV